MPKVSSSYKEARRQRILDAAYDCFQEIGYRETSIADISTRAGVSAGTIYNYFEGKQEVVRTVALGMLGSARKQLAERSAPDAPSPAEVIRSILLEFVPGSSDSLLVQINAESTLDPQLGETMREIFLTVRDAIAESLAEWARSHPERVVGDPEAWGRRVAPVLASIPSGLLLQRSIFTDFDNDDFLSALSLVLPSD